MIRKAFVMAVHPGQEAEYRRRHDALWPELAQTLKDHGASNYSIFLHPATLQLFGYVEIEDEARWEAVAATEVCQKWWAFMQAIMPSNPDNSPVSQALTPLFHLA
ncbi:L-rhamnose mutarotase [Pseudaeromonas sp. ZJS20]|uniref:L-rhamnose mutarotase n=1 Tax=Pseudaeromonas aegiceratis TaxID=3153928 RepID=UPI00390C7D73